MGENSHYPRPLTKKEKDWIEWILPPDRSGYRQYRELIQNMVVLGPGRRGSGNFILGFSGDTVDVGGPLPPVFAYGVMETSTGMISISLRENVGDQIDVEIVSHQREDVPEMFEEGRRWTYSTWSPGDPCPQCQRAVRQVSMHTPSSLQTTKVAGGEDRSKHLVLCICANDRRIWIFDRDSGVNRLIPVTNFYNELMLHKNIRDPKIAFDSNRLFSELSSFTDEELTYAFLTYNKLKTKVGSVRTLVTDSKAKETLRQKLRRIFSLNK